MSTGGVRSRVCLGASAYALLLFAPVTIELFDFIDAVRRDLSNEGRCFGGNNPADLRPVCDQDWSPHLRIFVVMGQKEYAASVCADGLHAEGVFQNALVRRDCDPTPLPARCQPNLVFFLGIKVIVMHPNVETFFLQQPRQLLVSQVAVEEEDVDFRLQVRSELPLRFGTLANRSLRRCSRFPHRY